MLFYMHVYLLNYQSYFSVWIGTWLHIWYMNHLVYKLFQFVSHIDLVFWLMFEMISMAFMSAVLKFNTLSSPAACKQAHQWGSFKLVTHWMWLRLVVQMVHSKHLGWLDTWGYSPSVGHMINGGTPLWVQNNKYSYIHWLRVHSNILTYLTAVVLWS